MIYTLDQFDKWEDMKNKVICGDALELLKRLPNNSIDLVLTSPPYDNLREYKGFSWDFHIISKELIRALKEGGVIVWIVGDQTVNGGESLTSFKQAIYFVDNGLKLHDTMIYNTNKMPLNHNRYEQCFEYMFVFVKGKIRTFNPIKEKTICVGCEKNYNNRQGIGSAKEKNSSTRHRDEKKLVSNEKIKSNIWFYKTGFNQSAKEKYIFEHPAIYPEWLARDHINSWSNKGDIVLDPFMGSWTTAKACQELGRDVIGCDLEMDYCRIGEQRLQHQPLFTV